MLKCSKKYSRKVRGKISNIFNYLKEMTILVTGGLGFIGTNFIKKWNKINTNKLICVDNNRLKIKKHNLIINNKNNFYEVSIGNRNEIKNILKSHKPI